MSFDFQSFRRLLYQNALDDAIDMLGKRAPAEFKNNASEIRTQLSSLRKSTSWNPVRRVKKNRHQDAIVRNLYQSGLAASKGDPPPDLVSVNPWMKLLLVYAGIILLIVAGGYLFFHQSPCPEFDENKEIAIIIDRFDTDKQPFLKKIGINKETLENEIAEELARDNIDVAIHPVRVGNSDQAKARCDECKAKMLIWGDVEYGDSIRAYLYHYLDHESYDAYILEHNIPGVEEHYKNIFKLKTSQWIGDIHCLIKLFQGLMAKEKFENSIGEEKAQAIADAEKLFSELSSCANDMALKIFALQCKGWAEVKRNKDTEAIATYNEILSLDSTNSLALNNSALLYKKQNNYLYAHTRYEKLLEKNDIPYVRLANAEALTKLDRKEEAAKEIKIVRQSDDYRLKKDIYETKIKTIPAAALIETGSVSSLSPSLSLNAISTQVNTGHNRDAVKNLDLLASQLNTSTFTKEDILIMSELYKNAGATEKAADFNVKAAELGVVVPANSTTIRKAVRRVQ